MREPTGLRDHAEQGASHLVPRMCVLALLAALCLGWARAGGAAQLKSVQTGTTTITAGGTSATGTLSPAVDTTKSFLVFSVSENVNRPDGGQISGQITNPTTVTFERIGTSGTGTRPGWPGSRG